MLSEKIVKDNWELEKFLMKFSFQNLYQVKLE